MNEQNQHIDFESLAARYLAGSATPQEVERLEEWVRKDEEKRRLFIEIKRSWMLAASAGQQFNKAKAWENISSASGYVSSNSKIISLEPKTTKIFSRFWKVAAAVLLLIAGSWSVYYFTKSAEKIMFAEQKPQEIILHDGSIVTLNAGSEITYPRRFQANERRVTLEGEAFFEVAESEGKPFVVEARGVEIRVLGTSFYVNARGDATTVEVIVSTGKVALIAPDNRQLPLTAGQKGVYNKNDNLLQEASVENPNFLAWKTRLIVFENTGLKEVFEVVGQTYGEQFSIADKELENCMLTATFHEKQLEDVLDIIRETFELQYLRSNSMIIVSGQGCD
jgi:transmembrane sensor